jgi:hypothetical protein
MKIFKSTLGRQEIILSVNLNQNELELKEKLWNWISEKHSDIFWDIEMHEGGRVEIHSDEISFWGDNGIFRLELTNVETIK